MSELSQLKLVRLSNMAGWTLKKLPVMEVNTKDQNGNRKPRQTCIFQSEDYELLSFFLKKRLKKLKEVMLRTKSETEEIARIVGYVDRKNFVQNLLTAKTIIGLNNNIVLTNYEWSHKVHFEMRSIIEEYGKSAKL